MKKRTIIGLAVLILLAVAIWQVFKEECGVGVDSVWWLPPEARSMTYTANGINRVAEFDIERKAFEEWCADRDMPLLQLSNPAGDHE